MVRVVLGVAAAAAALSVQAAKPVVELSLASPAAPFTGVSSAIASAEAARLAAEAGDLKAIDDAYKASLAEASVALGNTISKALGRASFANIAEPTISVKLAKSSSDEAAGIAAVKGLEAKRATAESSLVTGAKKEFDELAKVVIAEFDKQVRGYKGTSFLRYSREMNVRVVSDSSYATVGSLLEEMESRRDAGEQRIRSAILVRELDLVKTLNRIGAAALSAH